MASPNTRDRILLTSLALFNAEGLAAVSTHKIAAEMGISPGNLHYHFKAKQLIVERLFMRFEQRLGLLNGSTTAVAAIDDLWLALHLRFEAIDEYRFVYRDMAFLAAEYPALGQRAQDLTAQNLLAAQSLCEGLVASGVIQTSAEQARILALQIVFTTTCWLSFERLVPGREAEAQADPGLAAFYTLTLISPYVSSDSRAYLDYLRGKYLG
ncbi:TetR/AcrR family transcriptional regulator [Variovorax sp. J31P179]|uniref:TetR/AcrR family transcriptional regulator n=1 Tax=Variovorax sp. J31P179 TaxID=3053508 RepID=UPI0025760286|nr:TetR/AcrR family transcriptional regulator [Variovorax sp. J31P179]MDM0079555.1 TetR/AcrR family transcriptional regulator [Variovorax sp. J31P179]